MHLARLALVLLSAPLLGQEKSERFQVVDKHPDGSKHLVYFMDGQGLKQGKMEEFSKAGVLLSRLTFRDNELHGRYETFHPNRKSKLRGQYAKGEKKGLWTARYPNGKRRMLQRYRKGKLHGPVQGYHDNGERQLLARYKDGRLYGEKSEFDAQGELIKHAHYEAGKLHGKLRFLRGEKVLLEQVWDAGRIREMNGFVVYPSSVQKLHRDLQAIYKLPTPKPVGEDPAHEQRYGALRRLQAFRRLCALPYQNLRLDAAWNESCDLAAEVCDRNGALSHRPPRPAGMAKERYARGYEAAGKSNLDMGRDILRSVDAYMDDSDPSNIDEVGHRRWCLNPPLQVTGFGGHGRCAAMYAFDKSGTTPSSLDKVCFPPPGYVPVDMFRPHYAWHVTLLRGERPSAAAMRARIWELDEAYLKKGKALELNHCKLATSGYGAGHCLVFRPVRPRIEPGARYLVEISKDGGATLTTQYVVEFCAAVPR